MTVSKIIAGDKIFEAAPGTNLRHALLDRGFDLYSKKAKVFNCHGHAICGTCLVQVEGDVSAPTRLETIRMAFPPHFAHTDRRLACQVKILGDVRVTRFDGYYGDGNQTSLNSISLKSQQLNKNMKINIEKSDRELKTDVLSELKYEPSVRVTDIGVLVKDGTVTLNGSTTTYGEKSEAVRAVKRVAGVKAIADDIEVKLLGSRHRTDGDIAAAAAHHIDWFTTIPVGTVTVTVREGWITLEGEVEWWYTKNAAGDAVNHLSGVRGVSNLISIKPKLTATEIETAIQSAFKRNALLDANHIHVETAANTVILRGEVRNYTEREEAERIAWAGPGVFSVDNQLTVKWFGAAESE